MNHRALNFEAIYQGETVKYLADNITNLTVYLTEFSLRQRFMFFLLALFVWVGIVQVNGQGLVNPNLETQARTRSSLGDVLDWLEPLPPGTTVYYLKKGDTLYRLSQQNFVSLTEVLALNHVRNPERLAINTKIYIPPVNYTISNLQEYQPKPGDTRERLCAVYHMEPWQWRRLNPVYDSSSVINVPGGDLEVTPGKTIFLPRKPLPANPQFRSFSSRRHNIRNHAHKIDYKIARPVSGRLTSRFGFRWGRMHTGIDLAAPTGTPVKAALDGKVVFAGWRGGYGLLVIISHGGIRTYYGHLSVIKVTNGQAVRQGSLIGLVGSTGRAYGSHLHFEVEQNGKKINPLHYLSHVY